MNSKQILIIFLTVVLAVLIYFAPKMGSGKKTEPDTAGNFAAQFEEAKKSLSEEQKRILDIIKEESNSRLDCIRKIKGDEK